MLIPVLSFGALQAALISFFLIGRKNRSQSDSIIIAFLTVVALQLIFKVASKTWMWDNARLLYVLSYHLPLAAGPLLLLFVRVRQRYVPFKMTELFHFIPLAISFGHATAADFAEYNSQWVRIMPWPAIRLISLFVYGWLSVKEIERCKDADLRRMLKKFITWVISAETIIVITIALMMKYHRDFPDVRLLFIVLTLLIYWLSYQVTSGSILFGSRYSHSGLKPLEKDRIADSLDIAMKEDRLFLDTAVTIEALAKKIGVPKHHLSQVINERHGKTYLDYVNDFRLDEAARLLKDPRYAGDKIFAIALNSGFSSSSTFNKIFKRRFGLTPSDYRNS